MYKYIGIGELDVILSFSSVCLEFDYVKPTLLPSHDHQPSHNLPPSHEDQPPSQPSNDIMIKNGRHPLLEIITSSNNNNSSNSSFIPNDTYIKGEIVGWL